MTRGRGMVGYNGNKGWFIYYIGSPVSSCVGTNLRQDRAREQQMLKGARCGGVARHHAKLAITLRVGLHPVSGLMVCHILGSAYY